MFNVDNIRSPININDTRIIQLIEDYGMEGYGIYRVLVEILNESKTCKYPISLISYIAKCFNTTEMKIRAIIYHYELFEIEGNSFRIACNEPIF